MKTTALIVLCSVAVCSAFTTPTTSKQSCNNLQRYETATDTTVEETTTDTSNDSLDIPLTYNEMINQVSQCMSDAYEKGNTRQIVRILLPRDAANDQFGIAIEAEADTNDRNSDIKLVPTDESWQVSYVFYLFVFASSIY